MAATESFAVQEEAPLASAPTTTAEAAAPAEATDTPAADDAPAEGVEQKSAQFNQPSSTGLPQESAEAEGETGEALSDKSDSAGRPPRNRRKKAVRPGLILPADPAAVVRGRLMPAWRGRLLGAGSQIERARR